MNAVWRALRWELRECGSLARDLWTSRRWDGWDRVGRGLTLWQDGLLRSVIAFTLLVGGSLWLAYYLAGGWLYLAVWACLAWAVLAAISAVARGRHHIRTSIWLGLVSVTKGSVERQPAEPRRFRRQPKPFRVRWYPFTRKFRSARLSPSGSWPQYDPDDRLRLADAVTGRLRAHGITAAVDWPPSQRTAYVRSVRELPQSLPAQDWVPPRGSVLLGAGEHFHRRVVTVDGQTFVPWRRQHDPHLLIAGVTGSGKTATDRWLTRAVFASAEAADRTVSVFALDGKGGGNFSFLSHRLGCYVADTPAKWREYICQAGEEMLRRNTELRKWREARGSDDPDADEHRPFWPDDLLILVDELVDIAEIGQEGVMDPLSEIARKGREVGCTVIASVLRADVSASLSGLIREQFGARLLLGSLPSAEAARMMFGDQAKEAKHASDPHDADIPGRGVARVRGHIFRLQIPWVPDPADDPIHARPWLPPRRDAKVRVLDEHRRQRRPERPIVLAGAPIDLTDEEAP